MDTSAALQVCLVIHWSPWLISRWCRWFPSSSSTHSLSLKICHAFELRVWFLESSNCSSVSLDFFASWPRAAHDLWFPELGWCYSKQSFKSSLRNDWQLAECCLLVSDSCLSSKDRNNFGKSQVGRHQRDPSMDYAHCWDRWASALIIWILSREICICWSVEFCNPQNQRYGEASRKSSESFARCSSRTSSHRLRACRLIAGPVELHSAHTSVSNLDLDPSLIYPKGSSCVIDSWNSSSSLDFCFYSEQVFSSLCLHYFEGRCASSWPASHLCISQYGPRPASYFLSCSTEAWVIGIPLKLLDHRWIGAALWCFPKYRSFSRLCWSFHLISFVMFCSSCQISKWFSRAATEISWFCLSFRSSVLQTWTTAQWNTNGKSDYTSHR